MKLSFHPPDLASAVGIGRKDAKAACRTKIWPRSSYVAALRAAVNESTARPRGRPSLRLCAFAAKGLCR